MVQASAKNNHAFVDTSWDIGMVGPAIAFPQLFTINKANVAYPKLLSKHQAKSIDYVKKFSENRRKYLNHLHEKSETIFPVVESILKKHRIPEEFKILMAIESGFNANAVSTAGAIGYWQFMNESAADYGLKIDIKKTIVVKRRNKKIKKIIVHDERTDLLKSTHAAARYLRDRSLNLNQDWLLVAASYNCGVGNVWKAMKRTGKASPSFWDIEKYLPEETRNYVMNFITLNVIFKNYSAYEKGRLYFQDELIPIEIKNTVAEQTNCELEMVASKL